MIASAIAVRTEGALQLVIITSLANNSRYKHYPFACFFRLAAQYAFMRSACAFRCAALWRLRFIFGAAGDGVAAVISGFFGGLPRRLPVP